MQTTISVFRGSVLGGVKERSTESRASEKLVLAEAGLLSGPVERLRVRNDADTLEHKGFEPVHSPLSFLLLIMSGVCRPVAVKMSHTQ